MDPITLQFMLFLQYKLLKYEVLKHDEVPDLKVILILFCREIYKTKKERKTSTELAESIPFP